MTGAGLTVVVLTQAVLSVAQHPEEIPDRVTGWLRRTLHLSDEQAANVKEILVRNQQALWEIRRQTRPRVEAVLDRIQMEVGSVLNDQQAQRWNRRVNRLRQRWTQLRPKIPQSEDPRDGRKVSNGGE